MFSSLGNSKRGGSAGSAKSGAHSGSVTGSNVSGISGSKKAPIIFDIRIASKYGNLTLMPGSDMDSEPTVLRGDIVFSLPETLHVKRITLRLVGKFKLEFLQVGQHKNNSLASIVKEDQTIFEAFWQNLLIEKEGIVLKGGTNGKGTPGSGGVSPGAASGFGSSSASANSSKPILSRVRSVPMMNGGMMKMSRTHSPGVLMLPNNGVSGTPFDETSAPSGSSFVLPRGNYELPFQVTFPQDMPETVEGLQSGSVLYTMECCIERQGFNKTNFTKYEYLRIFRTLRSDSFAIQEEVYVGKNWPNKLQYEISIPSRAIPIGGATPLSVKLYPFQKGYKLKKIVASLIQYYEFKDSTGQLYDDENVIQKQMLTRFEDIDGCDCSQDNLLVDAVKINSMLQFPDDLKRATQDCDVGDNLIKVRHKLQVVIQLRRNIVNEEDPNAKPYEQSTDIKVNLPIKLYVMQHVPIQGRLVLMDQAGKIHFRPGQLCPLFDTTTPEGAAEQPATQTARDPSPSRRLDDGYLARYLPDRDVQAPPSYNNYQKDATMDLVTRSLPTTPSAGSQAANASPGYFEHPSRILAPQPRTTSRASAASAAASQPSILLQDHAQSLASALADVRLQTATPSGSVSPALPALLQRLPSYDESRDRYETVSREPTPLYRD